MPTFYIALIVVFVVVGSPLLFGRVARFGGAGE